MVGGTTGISPSLVSVYKHENANQSVGEGIMRVFKWGNSLAIRLPAAVVEALDLKEGDDIDVRIVGRAGFEIATSPGPTSRLRA